MKILYAALALAFVGASSPAAAQFTAAVIPPKPAPRVDTTARRDSLKQARASLAAHVTDMKTWVDSAAAALAALPPRIPAESAASAAAAAHPASVTVASSGEVETKPRNTTSFRNGAPAPATASPLPLLALVGAGTLLVGVALLRR